MNFVKLNKIGAWLVFAIALITYTLTVEPTASLWDCGEFIACAFKLQVPHPAGAPFFLLIGRIASMFAFGNVENVAFMINMVSVIASAFTILFLFWTISLLARKLVGKKAEELDKSEAYLVLGASLVGSLVYAFSDSFWFSAVEAEVYGMSSFFTAIVVWAAFRWELIEDEAASNKWLIFIAYLVGLSIGVHLLNLVTIPALALVYYYKKTNKVTWKGGIIAFLIGFVILGIVNNGVITGIPSISFAFERLFVNTFGLPFGSGMIFFIISLIAALVFGIIWSQKNNKAIINTALVSFAFILMGYSTYSIALIRSNYNPPINENAPSEVLSFIYYLKREQYGSRPLVYGPVYSAKLQSVQNGAPQYRMEDGKYKIYDYASEYEWDDAGKMLLPRVWSQDPNHIALYESKIGLAEGQNPTFFNNMEFMFNHQFGHMYWRYFLWNFWGRASDIDDAGPVNLFETKADLPHSIANNKARTNFLALPLILGLIGLLYQYFKRERDALVLMLLFIFTGLALVVYLNSPPVEPRERDYIYVGSFYFFSIWIGLGVMGIADYVFKFLKNKSTRALAATGLSLCVPILMVSQTYKSHNRSGRYHQIDFAKNMLNSCAPNAILFTGGDNDTFPLWYVQEVEGFRTDVRVCNLSLLGTDWYIDQMKRKVYESDPLPISLTKNNYINGVNDQIPFVANKNVSENGINLKQYLDLIENNSPAIKMQFNANTQLNVLPSNNLYLDFDANQVQNMNFVPAEKKAEVTGRMAWNLGERDLYKNDLVVLDVIAQNNWKRPIYFGGTLAPNNYLALKEYMQVEGYTYRLMPFKQEGARDGFVNSSILSDNLMNKSYFRNTDNEDVYYDTEFFKVPTVAARLSFLRLVEQLVREGKKVEAVKALDKMLEVMPDKSFPYDNLVANVITFYAELGETKKAEAVADLIVKNADEDLTYFLDKSFETDRQYGFSTIRSKISNALSSIQLAFNVMSETNPAKAKEYEAVYEKHLGKLK